MFWRLKTEAEPASATSSIAEPQFVQAFALDFDHLAVRTGFEALRVLALAQHVEDRAQRLEIGGARRSKD